MELGQKNYLWNWSIWFHKLFGLDIFNISGPLWVPLPCPIYVCTYLIEKLHYRNFITELHLRQNKIGYFSDPTNTNGWYYSPGYSYNLAKPNIIPIARNLLSNEVGRIANQKPVEHKIPSHYDANAISEIFEYTPTFQGKKNNNW